MKREELEQLDWATIGRRMLAYALRRLGSRGSIHDAEEIVQEAICQMLDPNYKEWDTDTPLDRHLVSTINGVIRNRTTKKASVKGMAVAPEVLDEHPVGHEQADEDALIRQLDGQKVKDLLFASVDGDDVVEGILILFDDGITAPRDIADKLGIEATAVYAGQVRLRRKYAHVRTQLEQGGLA